MNAVPNATRGQEFAWYMKKLFIMYFSTNYPHFSASSRPKRTCMLLCTFSTVFKIFSACARWISPKTVDPYLGWAPVLPERSTAAGSVRVELRTAGLWLQAARWGSGPPEWLQLRGWSAGRLSPEWTQLCGVKVQLELRCSEVDKQSGSSFMCSCLGFRKQVGQVYW